MIISNDQSSDKKLSVSSPSESTATTSSEPSQLPPPSFEEASEAHLLIDFAPNEPPPPFGEYQADFFTTGNGDIVSHDHHLNTDGEALYRFLLHQSSTNPVVLIHIRGTHTESRHVTVRDANGRTTTRHESDTVVDFDFNVQIGQHIQPPVVQFTVPDDIPAFRGRMFKQVEASDGSGPRKPKASERKAYKKWIKERDEKGLPPWQSWSTTPNDADFLRSSKTLRTWADEYCASSLILKEFSYEKVVYGWNMQRLQDSVRAAIKTTFYSGDVDVDIVKRASMINIRPNNRLSIALSKTWLKVLMIILLVYPFVWLFKRFHPAGGGRWQVGGGAYALIRWVPVGPERQAELLAGGSRYEGVLVQRRDGTILKAVGITESEWIRLWRRTIIRAVQSRYQSTVALHLPTVVEEEPINVIL